MGEDEKVEALECEIDDTFDRSSVTINLRR